LVATIEQMLNFQRITVDPAQMGGVACVRHLRIPVATVLRLLAAGRSESDILLDYPDLVAEDIRECPRFAAASAMERELPLPRSAVRFLIDNALPPRLPQLLTQAGHDATHVRTYGMHAAADTDILERANQEARIIV
jgi:uncharacterized protein (DUF433 family)